MPDLRGRIVIPLDEAQRYVREGLAPIPPVEQSLEEALGCVSALAVVASQAVPGFPNAAMDGFAIRSADTATGRARLRVVGVVAAGHVSSTRVEHGSAIRIMTGAPLPDGADSVCKIEEARLETGDATVVIDRVVQEGEHVRRTGDDVAVGQVVVARWAELGPSHLGVLAAQGCTKVLVHPRPRVGVLSTGDELQDDGDELVEGKIRDVNRPILLASLRRSGFTPVDLGVVGDTPSLISERIRHGLGACDAVISSGGVSVGDLDHVKAVFAELCPERTRGMQIAIKPGKPFAFGRAAPSGTPLFGLPGNPVSALVGFELLVRPALRVLAGHKRLDRTVVDAVLDEALLRRRDGKLHAVHVVGRFDEDGRVHVTNAGRQGSHLVWAMTGANGLALVSDGDGLAVGLTVPVMFLDGAILDGEPPSMPFESAST
jgi:molybdenum cofactor synthesis domain-containing protein